MKREGYPIYIDDIIVGKTLNKRIVRSVLEESLTETDFFCQKAFHQLNTMGLERNEALMLLAHHKSSAKYGYDLSSNSLVHLLKLAEKEKNDRSLQRLIAAPFFLVKTCWLYEHAPYFLFALCPLRYAAIPIIPLFQL